ncbi:MAG: helix-turn-helix transcriptional regulator [Verrucomicrobiota bacterium JB024]|nr:helix-turn-helix transcriptional regulator [Verrucomicrobiota bacterium JB024]
MKFTFSEKSLRWWDSLGDDNVIAAGRVTPQPEEEQYSTVDNRLVFGRFVHMLRRRDGLSIEDFANKNELDVSEIIRIENELAYIPDPRTVSEIANQYKLSVSKLMELAGINQIRDPQTSNAGLKFAARSESFEKLSKEQLNALEEFVHVLGNRD